MKQLKHIFYLFLFSLLVVSCKEKITIEPQEGPQLLGVYGSITDEFKNHKITLSRTSDFYATGGPEMISDATVFVYDDIDTVCYEETEENGVYQSVEMFSGKENHNYHLSIDLPEHEGGGHYYAQAKMLQSITDVDSIVIKQYQVANVQVDNVLGLYPYFQSIKNEDAYYLVKAYVNDSLAGGEKLTNCGIYNLGGMSGWYVNGPLMAYLAGEIPVWSFLTEESSADSLEVLHHGDTVRMDLSVITSGYAAYISGISSSNGSNPMMGSPSNVRTNIYPEGTAVGYFYAAAIRRKTVIY